MSLEIYVLSNKWTENSNIMGKNKSGKKYYIKCNYIYEASIFINYTYTFKYMRYGAKNCYKSYLILGNEPHIIFIGILHLTCLSKMRTKKKSIRNLNLNFKFRKINLDKSETFSNAILLLYYIYNIYNPYNSTRESYPDNIFLCIQVLIRMI